MKRHFEGREEIYNPQTGETVEVYVYYEYIPGRVGNYRAELAKEVTGSSLYGEGDTYEEAVERLSRKLLILAS
ncbi:MAG TPA: hypothetical protein GX391_03020 [Firmicutes bacterium]|nr:hypothetical protein [Bacillota bacterium]HOQ23891.1 hypothetical protein [Bacillota bacterium]HPT67143.1 hypothetical protein [Bacillota bacterium]